MLRITRHRSQCTWCDYILEGNSITCYPHCLEHAAVEVKVHPSISDSNIIPSRYSPEAQLALCRSTHFIVVMSKALYVFIALFIPSVSECIIDYLIQYIPLVWMYSIDRILCLQVNTLIPSAWAMPSQLIIAEVPHPPACPCKRSSR